MTDKHKKFKGKGKKHSTPNPKNNRKRQQNNEVLPSKKKKQPKVKSVKHESDDDVLDEDLQYFEEHGEFLEFLDNMQVGNHKTKKKVENVPDYEERKRHNTDWEEKLISKLPIKKEDVIIPVKVKQRDIVKPLKLEEDRHIENQSKKESGKKEPKAHKSKIEYPQDPMIMENIENEDELELRILVQRQNELTQKKKIIAAISTSIIENPETSVKKLKDLIEFCNDTDLTVQKMSLLSLLKIFKDIIPEYRIVTGLDEGVVLSKEVKNLRKYEYDLLSNYQKYIQLLQGHVKKAHKVNKRLQKAKPDSEDFFESKIHFDSLIDIAKVSIVALGDLLYEKTHFNYRSTIIQSLVPLLASSNEILSATSEKFLKQLFRDEKKGTASLEVVRAITQFIKTKNFKMNPRILKVLVYLNLTVSMEEDDNIFQPISKKVHMSKKQKKLMKKEKELEKEMAIVSAEENKQDAMKVQSEILKTIFLLYFRVLKNPDSTNLLAVVLEGMAQFSHLINVDLILNLLEVLKELIKKSNLALSSSMNCVITCFQTVRTLGDALNVDLKDFYTYFYSLIPKIVLKADEYETNIPLMIRCLELLLMNRNVIDLERIAAYLKRILSSALHLPSNGTLSMLSIIEKLLQRFPKTQQLLDTEFSGAGVYHPEIEDPEHTNALCSTAWEFNLLRSHFHPTVKKFSETIAKLAPVPDQTPTKLFNSYDFFRFGFVPEMSKPRDHVLEKVASKHEKKGRFMYHFIMPSNLYGSSSFLNQMEELKRNIIVEENPFKDAINTRV